MGYRVARTVSVMFGLRILLKARALDKLSCFMGKAPFPEHDVHEEADMVFRPPGVGKTYTVEAIAEWLHRPLLALTVADIGTVETRVERELIKWFSLAEAWNAVLLVDEADIFLERRQNRDLARNGLVSGTKAQTLAHLFIKYD